MRRCWWSGCVMGSDFWTRAWRRRCSANRSVASDDVSRAPLSSCQSAWSRYELWWSAAGACFSSIPPRGWWAGRRRRRGGLSGEAHTRGSGLKRRKIVEQAECTKAPAMRFRFSTLLQLTTVTASQFFKKTVTAPRDDRKQSMDEKWKKSGEMYYNLNTVSNYRLFDFFLL
jgi:hypothetical protein